MDKKKKKVDNVEKFTSSRIKTKRTIAEQNILRTQGTKRIKEGGQ